MIRVTAPKASAIFALALAAGLAGCNSNAAPAASAPASAYASESARPAGPPLPPGARCTNEIDKWQALVSKDVRNGMVDRSVYNKIEGEIAEAQSACAAGHGEQALRLVQESRARHGYPPG
ncbi:MAG TPA: hypothetical protein VMU56_10040 [Beijerinckiaceae bacterium]|nr:hypothetical protein [Beijerinckiaceae bacterium]